ncbi:MAG: AAA family ATPase, partial [Candidatus Methanomethylophilaceae archaeon]|nr:AAA family ATPase [Candidatus Methanomethylophilaceae archaeon]
MDWTEKYRPQSLDDVIGNPGAVHTLRMWAESWNNGIPEKRALILIGTPGIGKTTSAQALARDMGWPLIEMNSSDQRDAAAIEDVAVRGSRFNTFSDDGSYMDSSKGQRKLIVLDEADNFFGNSDRGAIPVITRLIMETQQPLILIVNDFYELSR